MVQLSSQTTVGRRFVQLLGSIVPGVIRDNLAKQTVYAGMKVSARELLGISLLLGMFLAVGGVMVILFVDVLTTVQQWFVGGATVIALFLPMLMLYFYVYFKADKRTAQVEMYLPDVLHMISANLHAGMTPFEAISLVTTHDFGALSEEFKEITTKSQSAVSFADLLVEVTRTIDSDAFERSMKLFASSLRSGGHVAELLEGLARDIRDRQMLKKELVLNSSTNAMFILFTVVIGTPLLLAISIYFLDVVSTLQVTSGGGISGQFGLGGLGAEVSITPAFLTNLSYAMLLVTDVLATMFIGSMIHGKPQKGLKFAFPLIIASYVIFIAAQFLIVYFIGSP